MDDERESPQRSHWGCVVAFIVPVVAVIAVVVWLIDRLADWSILPR